MQFAHADDEDHLSLLQTHMHRRDTKKLSDEPDLNEPDLNVMQAQLNKLKSNMASNKATHRKSMMMVGLESATPAKHTHLHNNATKNKGTKKKAKREPKFDKFAEAAFAKSHDAKKMERAAMASIMDDEASEIAEDESHVLSAGALNRLEEVAEQVARSADESEESQKLEVDERRHDERRHDEHHDDEHHHDHKVKKREDKHEEENDGEDPEAELVRLAHQRAQREEAKAQLAESAAKDAWLELEKFQAQRNIDASSIGVPVAFSVTHPGIKDKHHEWQGR